MRHPTDISSILLLSGLKAINKLNDVESLRHLIDKVNTDEEMGELLTAVEINKAEKVFGKLRRDMKCLDNNAFNREKGMKVIRNISRAAGIVFKEEMGVDCFRENIKTMVRQCILGPFLAKLVRKAVGDERNSVSKRIKNVVLSKESLV